MKVAHIVNKAPAHQVINQVVSELSIQDHNHVFYIERTLSIGPLFQIRTIEGEIKRAEYFKKLEKSIGCEYVETIYTITNFMRIDLSSYDKIIVWHGPNASELLLRSLFCYLLPFPLYSIDISKWNNAGTRPLSKVTECSPENIKAFIGTEEQISQDDHKRYKEEWTRAMESKSNLRIYNNQRIEEVEESYFDPYIISKASKEWVWAMRLAGASMGWNLLLTDDKFVTSRIVHLVESGILQSRDNLLPLREAYVRLSDI